MHVSVQKFTSTTRPRSPAGSSGSELSHPTAPASEGMRRRSKTDILSLPSTKGTERKHESHDKPADTIRGGGGGVVAVGPGLRVPDRPNAGIPRRSNPSRSPR